MIVAISFAIKQLPAVAAAIERAGHEIEEAVKVEGGNLVLAIDDIQLRIIEYESKRQILLSMDPVEVGCGLVLVLKYSGVCKVVGRSNPQFLAVGEIRKRKAGEKGTIEEIQPNSTWSQNLPRRCVSELAHKSDALLPSCI